MIEFYAGIGPDTQAIGIALEELFIDYTIMPGRAPLPVIAVGGARVVGAGNVLPALARKANRFLADWAEAEPWLSKTPPGIEGAEAALADGREFVLRSYSIVDMIAYPRFAGAEGVSTLVEQWRKRVRMRPGVGRGMVAVSR